MIIGLGVPLGIVEPTEPARPAEWFGSFVGGVDDRCAVIEHNGEMRGIRVDLSPLAARMIFGLSMGSLARRVVALEELLGREGQVLEERLIELGSWQATSRRPCPRPTFASRLHSSKTRSPRCP